MIQVNLKLTLSIYISLYNSMYIVYTLTRTEWIYGCYQSR